MQAAAYPERAMRRFWAKVEKGPECWLWTASLTGPGYGQFWDGKKRIDAHRFSYMALVGPVPEGLVLDHLCQTPACVNPAHLDPVTQRENLRRGRGGPGLNHRKTHCHKGHPFEGDNLYMDSRGFRHCRTCHRTRQRERWARLNGRAA